MPRFQNKSFIIFVTVALLLDLSSTISFPSYAATLSGVIAVPSNSIANTKTRCFFPTEVSLEIAEEIKCHFRAQEKESDYLNYLNNQNGSLEHDNKTSRYLTGKHFKCKSHIKNLHIKKMGRQLLNLIKMPMPNLKSCHV